jgi:hypothetical protein
VDCALADRATARDLALPQAKLEMQTENFFDLAHGQSLLRHNASSTFQWRSLRRRIVQRRSLPDSALPITIPAGPDH